MPSEQERGRVTRNLRLLLSALLFIISWSLIFYGAYRHLNGSPIIGIAAVIAAVSGLLAFDRTVEGL